MAVDSFTIGPGQASPVQSRSMTVPLVAAGPPRWRRPRRRTPPAAAPRGVLRAVVDGLEGRRAAGKCCDVVESVLHQDPVGQMERNPTAQYNRTGRERSQSPSARAPRRVGSGTLTAPGCATVRIPRACVRRSAPRVGGRREVLGVPEPQIPSQHVGGHEPGHVDRVLGRAERRRVGQFPDVRGRRRSCPGAPPWPADPTACRCRRTRRPGRRGSGRRRGRRAPSGASWPYPR